MHFGNQDELNIDVGERDLGNESRTQTGPRVIGDDSVSQSARVLQDASYQRLQQHLAKPARSLPLQVIWELGQRLHECRGRVGNWVNLAENLGYDRGKIERFIVEGGTRKETPGYMMLLDWTKQERGRSMFVLVETLKAIGRQDCVQYLIQEIEEMMYMFLFVRIVDETSPPSTSQHLKVRTLCDLSVKDSLENLLAGNSDDYDYEVMDVALHEKAIQFKGEEITLQRKSKKDVGMTPGSSLLSAQNSENNYPRWTSGGFSNNFTPSDSSLDFQESRKPEEVFGIGKTCLDEKFEITEAKVLKSASYENCVHMSGRYVNVETSLFHAKLPKSEKSVEKGDLSPPEEGGEEKSMTVEISSHPDFSDVTSMEERTVSKAFENQNEIECISSMSKHVVIKGHTSENPPTVAPFLAFTPQVTTSPFSGMIPQFTSGHVEFQQRVSPSRVSSVPCQGVKPLQMAARSFPVSPGQERKVYVTDECVYCGKTKTTEMITGSQHLHVSAGAHCPSCRCPPPGGSTNLQPANQQPGQAISSQSDSPAAPCDLVQPISDDAVSSTTMDDTESVARKASNTASWSSHTGIQYTQTSHCRATNSPVPMESEFVEWQESLKPRSSSQTDEGNIPETFYPGNSPNCPTACSVNIPETRFHHGRPDLFTPARKRCNTDPGVVNEVLSPDSCIAMAHGAFLLMAGNGSETHGGSMERVHQVAKPTSDSSKRSEVKSVQLTLQHVNDLLRNFPGWNAHVDERNVEKIMSPFCREDGHYVVWFMRSKCRIVLSVSHMGKLIHYAIYAEMNRQHQVDFHIFDERFTNPRTLLRHYQKQGLSPQTEQGQGQEDGFIHQQNLRESRRLARLSHVHMKFAYSAKGPDARKSV